MFTTWSRAIIYFAIALQSHRTVAQSSNVQVQFPSTPPSDAITAPADFVGLGFDGAFLNSYDNQFSYNLVDSLATHMSVYPTLRIGGTSSDKLVFDPNQQQPAKCIDSSGCPYGPGTVFSIGPSYFNGFKAFPNSPMTFQAPMARELNISGSLDIVTRAYAALGANRTAAIAYVDHHLCVLRAGTSADARLFQAGKRSELLRSYLSRLCQCGASTPSGDCKSAGSDRGCAENL